MAAKSPEAKARAKEHARVKALERYHRPGGKEAHTISQRRLNQTPEGRAKKAARAKKYYETPEQKAKRAEKSKARWADPVWRARNAAQVRAGFLRRNFNLTPEGYDALLASQGGLCAICLEPPHGKKYRAHVDHNHVTKKVRGILCMMCNQALGLFKEDLARLRRAMEYLEKHK